MWVKKALSESKELWLEIADIDNQADVLPLIQKYGFDQERALSTKLSAAQQQKLKKVASTYNLPPASLEQMKPWMAALTFAVLPLQKAGYDPDAGVDRSLKSEAEKQGEKVRGFETMEEQVRFFAELPEKEQVAFLEQSLDDASEGLATFDKLAEAWLRGDNKTIGDVIDGEMKAKAPEVYQKFLVERNIRWSEKIAGFIGEPTVRLIAVGAGHLAGQDSIQVQLAKRGIKVESY